MFLKTLHVKNIRSYVDDKIEFPQGSLLIEGDIGSGKSTILLAIDFALFGTRPSELPASSLLRQGTNRGEVVLEFIIDGKEIEIKRVLEKKGATVAQTSGHITINGTRKDLMSMGLKSIVFDLLGYPMAGLKAGKSIIYRYTVYTPQEQMKLIVQQKPDERLNTIRSIFNIDKYKRIGENSKICIREMRKAISHMEGIARDLKDKEEKRERIDKERAFLSEDLMKKESVYERMKSGFDDKKKEKEAILEALKRLNALMHDRTSKKARLENEERMLKDVKEDTAGCEKKLEKIDFQAMEQKIKDLEKETLQKNALKEKQRETEERIKDTEEKITQTLTRKGASDELTKKISALSECPTCRQKVAHEHKEKIMREEDKKIENFLKIGEIFKKTLEDQKKEQDAIKKNLDAIAENEKTLIRLKSDLKSFTETKNRLDDRKKKSEALQASIDALKKSVAELEKEIAPMMDIEEKSAKIEKELDTINGENILMLTQITRVKQQMQSMDSERSSIDKDIKEKTEAKQDSESLKETTVWLKDYFMPLMETMEKHIMQSIQRDFDMLFREWFNMLIDDDTLQARIDAEFTPLIEQNTFETSYDYLSGGEKTSIALAYRLALNKVINNISESIKTKDLLILDEPTEGFSTEQLDKVRDVLSELNLKQVIIVSHEEKVESFVDKTVKVVKKDHVSHIVCDA